MATLNSLKQALRQKATETASSPTQPLSDKQYSAGFDILIQGSGEARYKDFIAPQLSQLLAPLFDSRISVSVLEVGPGPTSVLEHLPSRMLRKIISYDAFECNGLFASCLEERLCGIGGPLSFLKGVPEIYRVPFVVDHHIEHGVDGGMDVYDRKYDLVIFCHSMYGMKPHHRFVNRALKMLDERVEDGMVVVFHRDGSLDLDGLVCHRTASFPTGAVSVTDSDEALDDFAAFIAGFTMQSADADEAVRAAWRNVCRALGRRENTRKDRLLFSSPEIMVAFTRRATALAELTALVPSAQEDRTVKNREANLRRPALITRPTEVRHVQHCIRWALKHGFGLTVLGGGHSGHCLQPSVVSVDMGAFDQVHVLAAENDEDNAVSDPGFLVIAGAGCKTGDIIRKAMAADLTVPLGARPSVGAGLWLQGGIGHLARMHGLACDAIIGAVMVSVESGQVLCIGHVPKQHQPTDAVRPENEADLLWAIKGAGTNFGIITGVTFKAYPAPTYSVRNWIFPLSDFIESRHVFGDFSERVAKKLPWNCSADAYLYWDAGRPHLGVTMFECSMAQLDSETLTPALALARTVLGQEKNSTVVDSVGLFETEMYMSEMHGGHAGGKTSSFKRCLLLKDIGALGIAEALVMAIETRPSPLCYLHLLQGGGAVSDVVAEATAFGCRGWDFACVITGVWPRDQDGTEASYAAVRWVYNVAERLLPLSSGAYGADLGPDPRDAPLAAKAFGPNIPRLARLKCKLDPYHVLDYACPLPKEPMGPKLIVLVTGESCAGKDYCAGIWVSVFTNAGLKARVVSISDATKREYAIASGANLDRLLFDRAYKEQHRPALTAFFQDQVRQRPRLPEEHFTSLVYDAEDVDVLLITGMRDEAPMATRSHLVPKSRVVDVYVEASREKQRERGANLVDSDGRVPLTYWPCFYFDNEAAKTDEIKKFAKKHLLPFFHKDLQRLADMVRPVPDFPRRGIKFQHVLNISQQPGGLALCTSLLESHVGDDWADVDAVVCCEAGGFVYASALASRRHLSLLLIREAGKLPPPTISVVKSPSHISSASSSNTREKRIEMERDVIGRNEKFLVIDDVLATGETLCAVLQLLREAGVEIKYSRVIVVAEFPIHRGRELLRQRGFGQVKVQSLLVYDGA